MKINLKPFWAFRLNKFYWKKVDVEGPELVSRRSPNSKRKPILVYRYFSDTSSQVWIEHDELVW